VVICARESGVAENPIGCVRGRSVPSQWAGIGVIFMLVYCDNADEEEKEQQNE